MVSTLSYAPPLGFNRQQQLGVAAPQNRAGFKVDQVGIIRQETTDEFGKTHKSPTVTLVQDVNRTIIYTEEPWINSQGQKTTKSFNVGCIEGDLPKGIELNVISGKDGRLVQLKITPKVPNDLKSLMGKSFLIPEGAELTWQYKGKPLSIKLFATQRTVKFSLSDYDNLSNYCSRKDPKLYQRNNTNPADPAFISLLSVGGAGSRLFPLSSATQCDAILPDGSTRSALPANAKPAGWLPGENKTMVGRALYYLTLAGVKKVYAPTVNINAPETVKTAMKAAAKDIKKETDVALKIKFIDEHRLAGQSSYVPDLWKKLAEKQDQQTGEKRLPYVISDFPDATYFPYPPYQDMMDEVRSELETEQEDSEQKAFDGWILAKTVEKNQLSELVNKYGETTWINHDNNHPENDGLLIGMHEKPKSVEEAQTLATEDLKNYNTTYHSSLAEADELIGYRLGTEIYSPELLKVACTNPENQDYPLIAERNPKGAVKLVNDKPIYSMYNVFHAVGTGTIFKDNDKEERVRVKILPLKNEYKWMDMGNIHGYLDTVRQLYYCLTGQRLRPEERHIPYPIGGKLEAEKTDNKSVYGKDVFNTMKKQLAIHTTGAVMLVDLNHIDKLNND
jgi:hypothetical protein